MPMREQSRIKADTVAEECTCEECPAPAPEPSGNSFRPTWGERFIAQDPAPEPSAPPAGVPVCKAWCGAANPRRGRFWQRDDSDKELCSEECMTAGKPLNPPPSAPVTVATGGPHCPKHPLSIVREAKTYPDGVTVPALSCEECAGETRQEAERVRAVLLAGLERGKRERDAAVATGGVPAGYRLGAGWVVDRTYLCSCAGCGPNTETEYYQPGGGGKGACAAHAVLMGALVPIDPARSVPPGPVPVDAHADDCVVCQTTGHIAQPAAPASEPAVRPLLWVRMGQYRPGAPPPSAYKAFCDEVWTLEVEKVPRLEAELAEAKCIADNRMALLTGVRRQRNIASDRLDAARAEVEQLRGRLADEHKRRGAIDDAEATARVRSMREAAALIADRHEYGRTRGCLCNACKSGRDIRALSDDQPVPDKSAESLETGRSVTLPLDTGTATDTSGEPQADAIKAAVDKERERCLAWWEWFWGDTIGRNVKTETGIRSGEDAPGAVGK